MPRVAVALFLSSFDPGGTERQMIELVRRLDRRRFDVHVACFRKRGAWLERAVEHASSVGEFPITSFRAPGTVAQARAFGQWCRERGIAIVHTTSLYANIFGLPAAALGGVPVRIGSRRELNPDKTPAQIVMQRAAYACAQAIVANSTAAAARLASERVPAARVSVIPNGIDVRRYVPVPERATIRRVVTVANLRQEKAHEVLLEAAATVVRRCPDAEFVIAGDGPRRSALEGLIRQRGLGSHVHVLGHCEDVPALLAGADLFVLPSRSEAFPNSVLEAMAAGLPIIATRVGGNVELLSHQRTGVLVPPDDARALGFAMLDLMLWPAHAATLGRAARRAVEATYSFDRMISSFEHLYLDHLRARAPVRVAASEMMAS